MVAQLSVQAVPGAVPPRVNLTLVWTGATVVNIRRRDPDGVARAVRGAEPAQLASYSWSGSDFESWFDYGHVYEASSTSGGLITSDEVSLSPEAVWLRHPGQPSRSMPVDLSGEDAPTRAITRSVQQPIGRSSPIVITDGVRRVPSGSYRVRTWDLTERDKFLKLINDGSVLLLDVPATWGWGINHQYVSIGDVTENRLWEEEATFTGREWTLPYDVVERQEGALAALINYGTVMEGAPTFTTWLERFSTYQMLLVNNSGTGTSTPVPGGGSSGGGTPTTPTETIVNTGGQFSATTWGGNPSDYSQSFERTNDYMPPVYVVITDMRADRLYTVNATYTANITGGTLSPSATNVTAKIVRFAGGVWNNFASAAKITISQSKSPSGQTTFSLSGSLTVPTNGTYGIGIALVITGGTKFADATDATHPRSVSVLDNYFQSSGLSGRNTSGDTTVETYVPPVVGDPTSPPLTSFGSLYVSFGNYQILLSNRSTYEQILTGA